MSFSGNVFFSFSEAELFGGALFLSFSEAELCQRAFQRVFSVIFLNLLLFGIELFGGPFGFGFLTFRVSAVWIAGTFMVLGIHLGNLGNIVEYYHSGSLTGNIGNTRKCNFGRLTFFGLQGLILGP